MPGRILGVTAGKKGDEVSVGSYVLKHTDTDGGTNFNGSVLQDKLSARCSDRGVGVGYEARIVRTEVSNGSVTMGSGLQADTGVSIGEDGFKLEVLGFGFSAGDDGVGFKLPFFDMKFK